MLLLGLANTQGCCSPSLASRAVLQASVVFELLAVSVQGMLLRPTTLAVLNMQRLLQLCLPLQEWATVGASAAPLSWVKV